jgi:hypothetical protein
MKGLKSTRTAFKVSFNPVLASMKGLKSTRTVFKVSFNPVLAIL